MNPFPDMVTASKAPSMGHRWKPGESGNPEGRRAEQRKLSLKGAVAAVREDTALTLTLAQNVDPEELSQLLLWLCRGFPPLIPPNLKAIQYVYDRLEGLPVQRHEAKLQSEVDATARRLAEHYGLSVEDVQARAKALSSGT